MKDDKNSIYEFYNKFKTYLAIFSIITILIFLLYFDFFILYINLYDPNHQEVIYSELSNFNFIILIILFVNSFILLLGNTIRKLSWKDIYKNVLRIKVVYLYMVVFSGVIPIILFYKIIYLIYFFNKIIFTQTQTIIQNICYNLEYFFIINLISILLSNFFINIIFYYIIKSIIYGKLNYIEEDKQKKKKDNKKKNKNQWISYSITNIITLLFFLPVYNIIIFNIIDISIIGVIDYLNYKTLKRFKVRNISNKKFIRLYFMFLIITGSLFFIKSLILGIVYNNFYYYEGSMPYFLSFSIMYLVIYIICNLTIGLYYRV